MLINNAAQARREQTARDAERKRTHAERREAFELAHLQDLHTEFSELLLVAETRVLQWCRWLRMLGTPGEDLDRIASSLSEPERVAKLHLGKINRLAGLVIPNGLRNRVLSACAQYERLREEVVNDGPEKTQAALPGVIAQLHAAQSEVAERIREIYVSAENLPGTTAARQ